MCIKCGNPEKCVPQFSRQLLSHQPRMSIWHWIFHFELGMNRFSFHIFRLLFILLFFEKKIIGMYKISQLCAWTRDANILSLNTSRPVSLLFIPLKNSVAYRAWNLRTVDFTQQLFGLLPFIEMCIEKSVKTFQRRIHSHMIEMMLCHVWTTCENFRRHCRDWRTRCEQNVTATQLWLQTSYGIHPHRRKFRYRRTQ